MALINYIEPVEAGKIFVGLGGMVLSLVLSWIFYRLYKKFIEYLDVLLNREMKYEILEEKFLDEIGMKKNFDLNKELVKRKILEKQKKTFRKRLEEQIYEEMFGEEKKGE